MAEFDIRGRKVLIDDGDLALVQQHKWWFTPQGYACTKVNRGDGTRRTIGMHRIILGDPPSPAIDHINRNRQDNRRCNIKACSDSENGMNIARKGRGVSKRGARWQVVVREDGRLKWLGAFDTKNEADEVAARFFAGIEDVFNETVAAIG